MKTVRLKMLRRAVKIQRFCPPLKAAFDREFGVYDVPDEKVMAIVDKALAAIKKHNIVSARFEDFGLTLHVRAYKMPTAKQLAAFDEIVKAFN